MLKITDESISPELVIDEVKRDTDGAVVSFIGIVRGYQEGKRILHLEYDAYAEMAERKLKQIADEVQRQWEQAEVSIIHRIGRLQVGETIVVIAIGAPHRKEAFEACQYAIDRLKQVAPIWKKEVWEGGEAWVK